MAEHELWRGRKTHCKRGHKLTAKTVTVTIRKSGLVQRQCRVCDTERCTLRYHSNPEYRAAALERSKAQYAAIRAEAEGAHA